MVRWLATLVVLCAFVLPGARAAEAARGADGLLLVPPLARVYDPEGYLTPADRTSLENRLAAFEAAHGSQIAIVLVASTRPEPIEDYAHRVGEAWKIGRRGIGDGVLIVVAIQDRAARIDVARRLEGAIPDVVAHRLIREKMGPRFAAKDYAGGLIAATDALFALISAEGLPPGVGTADAGRGGAAPPGADAEQTIRSLIPFVIGGLLLGAVLRRLLGLLGTLFAAAGAAAIVGYLFSSLLLAGLAGILVFVLSAFGAPMLLATQVLGGRGGGGFPGWGPGGGGFTSGGGGDFSGGGASGNW
ncbi:MAG TPA: TPM domain-containing protein [Burkholderiaceae bacterium]|nr:TPM domain-containing protein [Burkholderiaceae bacterium]